MMGMLEMVVMLSCRPRYTSKVAFSAGSSKHGKARRASVAWNCVTPIALRQESDHQDSCLTSPRDALARTPTPSKTLIAESGRLSIKLGGKCNLSITFHI